MNLIASTNGTGEITDCDSCQELAHTIAGLESTIRSQARTISKLRADKDNEARTHRHWDEVKALHDYWREKTGRKRCRFSPDRFWLALPFFEQDGVDLCLSAIDGRVFDHYKDQRANGSTIHYWEWERIFKDRGEFEESVNRAPR